MSSVIYALISACATLVGGILPLKTKVKQIPIRYLLAFAAGVLIATAFLDMLPEAELEIEGHSFALIAGFFVLYLMEKIILIHTCGEAECTTHSIGWVSMVGITLESFVDGLAIAAGFAADQAIGIVVAIAVIAHEIPRGFSTSVVMKNAGYGISLVLLALFVDAFAPLLGVFVAPFLNLENSLLLAFTAGTFIYVGASDLLPEAHQKFNIKVVGSVIFGVVLVILLENLTHAFVG